MMRLHSLRAARASLDGFADSLFIDIAADANHHANDLQCVRMIVKNEFQPQMLMRPQESGGAARARLAK